MSLLLICSINVNFYEALIVYYSTIKMESARIAKLVIS